MLPDWHHPLELIHDPLARRESGASMPARHPHHDRRLRDWDEADAVMKEDLSHFKFLRCAFRHEPHLMFRHCSMRFVFYSGNVAAILTSSHSSPKNDDRARAGIVSLVGQIERPLGE